MTGFIIGLIIGVIGCIVVAVLVYKNNKKKISQALVILADNTLTSDQKIAKIKALFNILI